MVSANQIGRAFARAAIGFGIVGAVASCSLGSPPAPAPVYFGSENNSGWVGEGAPSAPLPPLPRRRPPEMAPGNRVVIVERGQSLGFLAHRYHVSERAIIAANHLHPPYQIDIGSRLLIPGGGEEGSIREAELAPAAPLGAPPQAAAPPPRRDMSLRPEPPPARQPDVIPLDSPAPPETRASEAGPGTLTPPPGEQSAAEEARADSAPAPAAAPAIREGRFPWPVRGRILVGYGASTNGGRNDGINIAAPKGTPVRVIDGGEVAYAGNELRGYGDLILVKHPGGWISAYAHCEDVAVKKGDTVSAGQVIARVGTTGGVEQPQLHFELRRGDRPVDPRDFLAPLPRAANRGDDKAG